LLTSIRRTTMMRRLGSIPHQQP